MENTQEKRMNGLTQDEMFVIEGGGTKGGFWNDVYQNLVQEIKDIFNP